MHWTIRAAEPSDAVELASRIDAAYSAHASHIPDLPEVSEGIADDIAQNVVFVATTENKVIGGIVLILQPDHLMLANIAVDPSAEGNGIARALIETAEQVAQSNSLSEIRLSTHVKMPENISLYEHLGWHQTGKSGNKVHMSRKL